ncbi:S-phase kinase-associated protein 2-like [Thrips palmi]|uniref:S-phase kinase-associated protein 2-like n=1 Tax=Thrips palmi TaxID=161013 RepID=A0A6P8ZPH5_THRPL|nr:S-phase kinase-associated protein 2-like [Thrips palmi]
MQRRSMKRSKSSQEASTSGPPSDTPLEFGTSHESSSFLKSGIPPEPSTCLQSFPSLESLPRELLLAVLAYVPTEQLLPLRLLGRRWKTLILEEPLWRHRRLDVPECINERPYAAILRLAPALDTLKLETGYPTSTQGIVYLKALAEGKCKIRFLHFAFGVSSVSNKLISKVLSCRTSSLQQLNMSLNGCVRFSNLVPALDAIDALKELKTLTLTVVRGLSHGFAFKCLRLTNLDISMFLSVDMARNLIHLGRNTLTAIKCDMGVTNKLKADLVLCKNVTHLTVTSPFDGLDEVVPQLPSLQYVTIQEHFRITPPTMEWLQWAHSNFSGKVHFVMLNFCTYDKHLILSDSLRNVHSVTLNINGFSAIQPEPLAQFLKSLTAVEQLVLNFGTDIQRLLFSWPASSVPRLQCLSIRARDQRDQSSLRILTQAFKIWRPSMQLKFL